MLFAVGVSHSLKLSLLYYWIADVQKLQGPDSRPVWERGEARLCPATPAEAGIPPWGLL